MESLYLPCKLVGFVPIFKQVGIFQLICAVLKLLDNYTGSSIIKQPGKIKEQQ